MFSIGLYHSALWTPLLMIKSLTLSGALLLYDDICNRSISPFLSITYMIFSYLGTVLNMNPSPYSSADLQSVPPRPPQTSGCSISLECISINIRVWPCQDWPC